MDQTLRSFIDSPLDSGKRSGRVENVLTIVQIQNRVTSQRKTPITGRQVDEHIASISQYRGVESAMSFDIAGKRVFAHENEDASCRSTVVQPFRLGFRWLAIKMLARQFVTEHRMEHALLSGERGRLARTFRRPRRKTPKTCPARRVTQRARRPRSPTNHHAVSLPRATWLHGDVRQSN